MTSPVTVTGQRFSPNSPIEIFLQWKRCAVSTDAQGQFSCPFKVPKSLPPGPHKIGTVNRANGRWINTAFRVGETAGGWPQYRYSARREGASPEDTVLSTISVGQPSQRCSFQTSSLVHNSVSVVGGIAYFGSLVGYLYATDAATGRLIWRTRPVPPGAACCGTLMNTGSPSVANGKI